MLGNAGGTAKREGGVIGVLGGDAGTGDGLGRGLVTEVTDCGFGPLNA
jgi:hypothetical protein